MTKRKKYTFIIILIGLGYYLFSFHSENKKYAILSEIFEDTEFYPEKICAEPAVIRMESDTFKLTKHFARIDLPSAYSQIIMQNLRELLTLRNQLKPNHISLKTEANNPEIITDCSTEMKEIKKGKVIKWYINSNHSISFPILSADHETAIIQIENQCGMLCGSGDIYVFKKIDGKWKVVEKVQQWIS